MPVMNALSLALVVLILGCFLALFLGVQSADAASLAPSLLAHDVKG